MANEVAGRLSRFDFTPATFTPVQYTPQVADSKEITSTIEKQQTMANNTVQARANFSDNINKYRLMLHPTEQAAFDERMAGIKKNIDDEIRVGNYGSAMKYAQQQGIALADDIGLQNKVQANQKYQEAKQKIMGDNRYNEISKNYWLTMNPYKDDGTGNWEASFDLTPDTDDAQLVGAAFELTSPSSQSTSSQTSRTTDTMVDKNGNVTTDYKNAVASSQNLTVSSQSSRSVQSKTYARLEKTLGDLMQTSKYRRAMMQQYMGIYYYYKKYEAIANNPEASEQERQQAQSVLESLRPQMYDDKGRLINTGNAEGFNDWVKRKAKLLTNMAYVNVSTSSGSGYSLTHGYRGAGTNGGSLPSDDVSVLGDTDVQVGKSVIINGVLYVPTPATQVQNMIVRAGVTPQTNQ